MKKQKITLTREQRRLAKKIFEIVYKWGKEELRATPKSPYYEELIWKIVNTKK